MSAAEQFVLTISERGYGKRSSSYQYRTTGRGGKGIVAMAINQRNGRLVASFPVEESDQIMLVTDRGQLIRCGVDGIRIAGRSTQGVIVFDTADDERVVSVERLGEDEGNGGTARGSRERRRRRLTTPRPWRGSSRLRCAGWPRPPRPSFGGRPAPSAPSVRVSVAAPATSLRIGHDLPWLPSAALVTLWEICAGRRALLLDRGGHRRGDTD